MTEEIETKKTSRDIFIQKKALELGYAELTLRQHLPSFYRDALIPKPAQEKGQGAAYICDEGYEERTADYFRIIRITREKLGRLSGHMSIAKWILAQVKEGHVSLESAVDFVENKMITADRSTTEESVFADLRGLTDQENLEQ